MAAPEFPPFDTYVQRVEIVFANPASARRARLKVAPLYRDYLAAFSSRWDDNHFDDLKVAEVMKNHGVKGTFYLGASSGWHDPGKAGMTLTGPASLALPRAMVASGHSIGDHTLSHEFLPALSRNRAFEEILGLRVDRETSSQSPVVCFTYPFMAYRDSLSPQASQADIEEMLIRSGIYFLGEDAKDLGETRLLSAKFVSLDGNPYGNADPEKERSRKSPPEDGERPFWLTTMHAWADPWGGAAFPKLSELYRRWARSKALWYCNQNQYAAYKAQVERTLVECRPRGNRLIVTLVRPDAADMGDEIPLSFFLEGADPRDVLSVTADKTRVAPFVVRGRPGFDLAHSEQRGLPILYSRTDNPENRDDPAHAVPAEGMPGLKAQLVRKDDQLVLTFRNAGARILHGVRVTFRTPLHWETGGASIRLGGMAPGATRTVRLPLKVRPFAEPFLYSSGTEFFAAQVDFNYGESRARLWATCRGPGHAKDPSYPRDGFLVLGPLPVDRPDFNLEKFTGPLLRGAKLKPSYELFEDEKASWKTPGGGETAWLDPNIIFTTGKSAALTFYTWDPSVFYPHGKDLVWLLAGRVFSPSAREATVSSVPGGLRAFSVNGRIGSGSRGVLQKGWNDLRILYRPVPSPWSAFSQNHYGAYFRMTDEKGVRMADLTFERPPIP